LDQPKISFHHSTEHHINHQHYQSFNLLILITVLQPSFKLPKERQTINMPFFQPAYLSPEASFFQLLSELDQPAHKTACRPQQRAQTFTPRFDITETADSYDLYGELPGVSQDSLSIEFSDAQTIVIKGKTQRALNAEATQPEQTTSEKGKEKVDASSEKSYAPTVEDDYDDVDAPVATPATTVTATEEQQQPQTTTTSVPKPKIWVAERKFGEFARSFSFSQRIEQDFVSADLRNGVLHVVVPKSQKARKVTVTVN
jgi:HSP20 family protein